MPLHMYNAILTFTLVTWGSFSMVHKGGALLFSTNKAVMEDSSMSTRIGKLSANNNNNK